MSAFDINGFNYGPGMPSMVMPPAVTSSPGTTMNYGPSGASDPVTAAIQNQGKTQASPSMAPQVDNLDSLIPDNGKGSIPGATGALGGSSPGVPDAAGKLPGGELGLNVDTFKLGLGGIQTAANIWAAFQAQDLAKKNFAMQRDFAEQNMANSIMAYNTTLQDRIRARTAVEAGQAGGMTPEQGQAYLAGHELQRRRTS